MKKPSAGQKPDGVIRPHLANVDNDPFAAFYSDLIAQRPQIPDVTPPSSAIDSAPARAAARAVLETGSVQSPSQPEAIVESESKRLDSISVDAGGSTKSVPGKVLTAKPQVRHGEGDLEDDEAVATSLVRQKQAVKRKFLAALKNDDLTGALEISTTHPKIDFGNRVRLAVQNALRAQNLSRVSAILKAFPDAFEPDYISGLRERFGDVIQFPQSKAERPLASEVSIPPADEALPALPVSPMLKAQPSEHKLPEPKMLSVPPERVQASQGTREESKKFADKSDDAGSKRRPARHLAPLASRPLLSKITAPSPKWIATNPPLKTGQHEGVIQERARKQSVLEALRRGDIEAARTIIHSSANNGNRHPESAYSFEIQRAYSAAYLENPSLAEQLKLAFPTVIDQAFVDHMKRKSISADSRVA